MDYVSPTIPDRVDIGRRRHSTTGEYLYAVAYWLPANSKLVEIGCLHGQSTVLLTLACAESDANSGLSGKTMQTIDDFSNEGDKLSDSPSPEDMARRKKEVLDRLNNWQLMPWFRGVNLMKSQAWFEKHPEQDVDFFFVDGCHLLAGYDTLECWKRLKPGGIILVKAYDKDHPIIRHDVDALRLPGQSVLDYYYRLDKPR